VRHAALLASVAALLLLGLWLASPGGLREVARERAADLLHAGSLPGDRVVVVDIDRDALAAVGPWPWSRTGLAHLVEAVAAARPAAIALDVLLAEPDRLSPAVLARQLADLAERPELTALAATLEDGDAALADALERAPAALGFVLEPRATGAAPPAVPILLAGELRLPGVWAAPGLTGPPPRLAAAAEGLGALSLNADADGRVRRVPLLVLAGAEARPGLAAETVRLGEGAEAILLAGQPPRMVLGDVAVPLDGTATLRLPAGAAVPSLSAAALLADPAAAAPRLAGRIVVVGGSAPELGGLRPAAHGVPVASVQLQAAAVAALLIGGGPVRGGALVLAETAGAALLAASGVLAALLLRPWRAMAVIGLLLAGWVALASALVPSGLLLDPLGPPALGLACHAIAALLAFTATERRARALRARFEQRLPPDVVARLAATPDVTRLPGETREVTALFTDLEGFTAMTERAAPEDLVAFLDAYLDALTRVVLAHGGMVEKIVGDAVHAVFNAPLDLPEHPRRARDCALALLRAAEAARASPLGIRLGAGRTRIGIETGRAVVGDVGGAGRLDYTAHGDVMNTAARLEAANKTFGTSVLIGPVAAARLGTEGLRPLGLLEVRGRSGALAVHTVE
jgi:adenylate cyclase